MTGQTPPIRIAILTVSDTASVNPTFDASGPAIKHFLSQPPYATSCLVLEDFIQIVPDELAEIQNIIEPWCASNSVDWIITTGGTGFGRRDVTPEAISPLLTRPAPGLVHLLLASSLTHTPLGALSRPVAGTIANTLVTTLPGSVKAVKEGLAALLQDGVVLHAIDLVRGGTGREVHAKLAAAAAVDAGAGASASAGGEADADAGAGSGTREVLPRGNVLAANDQEQEQEQEHGHDHTTPTAGALDLYQDQEAATTTTIIIIMATTHHRPDLILRYRAIPLYLVLSARHRKSPFPMISLEAALAAIEKHVRVLDVVVRKVDHTLAGYILAEDVFAPHDVPLRPTTSVDGYAVSSTFPPGTYPVLTSYSSSSSHSHSTSNGTGNGGRSSSETRPYIYRINTGAPLPLPPTNQNHGTTYTYDSVIMVEDTELVSTHKPSPTSSAEEAEVRTLVQVRAGENVRVPGSDVRRGERVASRGQRVGGGGGEVGTLVGVGKREVKVYKKPVVALLSTGNELVDLHSSSSASSGSSSADADGNGNENWGGIYDTNRPSLRAVLEGFGYEVIDLGIVPDDITAHTETLRAALDRADLVLTTGGTSMGPTDLLKPVIERYLHGTVHFGRVAVKPGKPTTFASVPVEVAVVGDDEGDDEGEGAGDAEGEESASASASAGEGGGGEGVRGNKRTKTKTKTVYKPVFALPGNPASALVTFYVFVLPALRQMGGWPEKERQLPRVMVQIQDAMQLDPRVEFHRVTIKSNGSSTVLKAYSTGGQRSSRVASLAGANGFVVLPALDLPHGHGHGHGQGGFGSGFGLGELGDKDLSSGAGVQTRLEVGEYAQAILIGPVEMV
ncbi:Gephyrin [Psilocybe cubensis]|uniref:MoaB/Mog domain-containing protein n=2 Tax=Psilocybe cubensis TaxID=181762 RepID=A0A8H8CJI1_PSICU|nr:Gephyrin [Psilocybe cubensis]KAH9482211.1 Gephyrin [Psilocybe cubensis]